MRPRHWFTLLPVFARCLPSLPLSHLWYMARQLRNENPHRHDGRLHINTFFPPYPSGAFERFLAAAIARQRIPYSTYFAVTDECPYHCRHCSYAGRAAGRLDTAQAKDIICQIVSIGTITVGFTGGEPLMRDDIAELLSSAHETCQVATVLFTTGHRLTPSLARSLRHAGLDCIMIGLESNDAASHDAIRGSRGSFEEAMAAIRLSLEAGLYTAISTMATRQKLASGEIHALAELAASLGVHEFRILEPIPTTTLARDSASILTADESRALADFHVAWNRRRKGPAVAAFSYLESPTMFGCGAGFHHLFIDALGNVCPCDLTPLSFGNLRQEPLADIWARMGRTFGRPRCSCLMKDLLADGRSTNDKPSLPVSCVESLALCSACTPASALPEIYRRLFRC